MKEHLTRVTRKGQITVPVEVRRALGLQEGDNVAVVLEGGRATLERRPSFVARTAGVFKANRARRAPEQEQEDFERGVAAMERFGATALYSFDRQFNRIPGITRLEPEADS
jgi:AbrB family looped-hinge helix DNA binding protein